MITIFQRLTTLLKLINTQNNQKLLSKLEFRYIDENINHLRDDKQNIKQFINTKQNSDFTNEKNISEVIGMFNCYVIEIMRDIENLKEVTDIAEKRNDDYFKSQV